MEGSYIDDYLVLGIHRIKDLHKPSGEDHDQARQAPRLHTGSYPICLYT